MVSVSTLEQTKGQHVRWRQKIKPIFLRRDALQRSLTLKARGTRSSGQQKSLRALSFIVKGYCGTPKADVFFFIFFIRTIRERYCHNKLLFFKPPRLLLVPKARRVRVCEHTIPKHPYPGATEACQFCQRHARYVSKQVDVWQPQTS